MEVELARSKSGHDKDHIYVVIREENGFVYLADGESRPVSRPKKKNKRHIQPIHRIPAEVRDLFLETPQTDLQIKRALKMYRRITDQQSERQ